MSEAYQPIILTKPDEQPAAQLVDAWSRQLRELFFIDNHQYIGQDKDEVYAGDDFKKYCEQKQNDFVYVHYPWHNITVKCVKAEDYFRLKTNRNQDLITAAEQKILYEAKVAVLGMSVGSNIAFVLTQAGISRQITLADFDELDTSNLNRILAGVHQVGLNKAIIAARHIYEDNPFAEVNALTDGISPESFKTLCQAGAVQYLIEEIDNIKMKIEIRQVAREFKIPVIMITDNGDGVVLHVERYDLGYDKIFDKDDAYWAGKMNLEWTRELAGATIMNDIVGGPDKVDPKMLTSVQRVFKKELVSWSQLGSAAILGGVAATVALKRIILGVSKSLTVREYIHVGLID